MVNWATLYVRFMEFTALLFSWALAFAIASPGTNSL